jgi:hypothetical protein
MTGAFTESVVEQAALAWLESLGRSVTHSIDPDSGLLRRVGRGPATRYEVVRP